MQRIEFIGNLGRDPEVKDTSGKTMCKFSVAVNEKWTSNGIAQEHTEWFSVVTWDKLAENCGQYLAKGRQVFVEGKLRTRSYEGKDGQERKVTEVIASRVQFLGGNTEKRGPQGQPLAGDNDNSLPF